jgi:hypothetical protein
MDFGGIFGIAPAITRWETFYTRGTLVDTIDLIMPGKTDLRGRLSRNSTNGVRLDIKESQALDTVNFVLGADDLIVAAEVVDGSGSELRYIGHGVSDDFYIFLNTFILSNPGKSEIKTLYVRKYLGQRNRWGPILAIPVSVKASYSNPADAVRVVDIPSGRTVPKNVPFHRDVMPFDHIRQIHDYSSFEELVYTVFRNESDGSILNAAHEL